MPQETKQPKTKEEIIEQIKTILKEYQVERAGIFGSFARGDDNIDSDLDLLIESPEYMSLLDFTSLKLDIEEKLGRNVDLVDYETIKPLIREKVLKQEQKIL